MSEPNREEALQAMATRVDHLASRFFNRISRRKEEALKLNIDPPWKSWELDEKFFQALFRWTLDNPERSLDRVLDNVRDRIETLSVRDFMGAIPDSPFPARSLVIALAHLLKLGMTVRRAQKDVQEFAKDVVRWVGLLKSSFQLAKNEEFARQAWRDLKNMRELIDKICLWAAERLSDGRWLRIEHGLMIHKEIMEFNERIASARALFQDLSAINLARGLDTIVQRLRRGQQAIAHEIKMLQETQKKQLDRIISEIHLQKEAAERERVFVQTLDVHAIATPSYDSEGKRPCDPDTRVAVLDDIRRWRDDIEHGSPNFFWLTGDPGCGKSAITASFARECKDDGVLWAQFFNNRNKVGTTDPRSYFPSIARQLSDYSPEVAKAIHHTLIQRRSLTDDISADQAAHLFASSIHKASELDPNRPVVVVIDGLDETQHERLEDTATIFSTLFTSLLTNGNIKVFISSRTETEIQKSFVLPIYEKHVRRVHLSTADPSSIRDVSHYIKRNLFNLVQKYDLNWDVWPGDERSWALEQRASGLFIWAVTAIKFIEAQLYLNGKECLNDVLDMLTADVLHDINTLYTLILKINHGNSPSDWELERFRRIIGAIVFLQEPLCINDLAKLLDLRKDLSSEPVDLIHFVRRFRTILVASMDVIDGETIPRIHKSVFEFITSNQVDPKFRVEPAQAHLELAVQCLAHLGAARESTAEDTLPILFRYAVCFRSSHLLQSKTPRSMILYTDYRSPLSTTSLHFNFTDFTHPVSKPIQIRYFTETSDITVAFNRPVTWDAVSGAYKSYGHLYHEGYVGGLVFSLGGNEIVSCSNDESIKICDVTNDREIRTLIKHSSGIRSLAFFPDGKSIMTGSNDGLIHIWDYSTGVLIGQPLRGHKDTILGIAFSHDGGRIVSGSGDKTCILWDVQSRQAIGEPWTGHKHSVRFVAFSRSNQRVCSVDATGYCIIWDVNTGQKISSWKYGKLPICSSFSPTDDDVTVVGGWDGIKVRSNNQMWMIPDSESTSRISFSLDGQEIIFSTRDTISVAEIGQDESSARIVKKTNFPSAYWIHSAAFSPALDYFVYTDADDAIHLFSLNHTETSLKVIPIHTWARTKLDPNIDGAQKLKGTLPNTKKTQHIHDTLQATNRRLRGITWYKADSVEDAVDSAFQECVVMDDVLIAGYRDGSVSIWDHGNMEENKTLSSSTR